MIYFRRTFRRAMKLFGATALFAALLFGWYSLSMAIKPESAGVMQPASLVLTPTASPSCTLAWQVVDSPNLGSGYNELYSITAVSANDIWAAGYGFNAGTSNTLIEHWDGTQWVITPSPNPGPGAELRGVVAISATDIWASGSYYNGSVDQTLTEHWDGSTWNVIPSPNVGLNDYLFRIAAISTNDAWAAGYYFIDWQHPDETLIEHWDGSNWNILPSPNVGTRGNRLYDMAAVSANDVWAVGYYTSGSGALQTLIEHWDGSNWSIVASPNVGAGDNSLSGVRAVLASDIWAVGYYDSYGQSLIEHWNGTQWDVVPHPNPGVSHNLLLGLTVLSASDIWAVGRAGDASGFDQTLAEHWDGTQWSVIQSHGPGTAWNSLYAIDHVSASELWAAGSYMNLPPDDQNRT